MMTHKTILYGLLLLFLTACKKDPVPVVPTKPAGTGLVRPVGTSIGNVVESAIGVQGGTLLSGDGRIELSIPAGALPKDITIGIEPITRTLQDAPENAARPAYRLTPHGQTFAKPVTITFRYNEEEFVKMATGMPGIAYQDEEGKWRGLGKVQVNTATKTLSVSTTHFSDWTAYEGIYLEPKTDFTLEKGKTATLNVMTVISLALTEEHLNDEDYYLEEPSPIPAAVDWRIVNGPGNGNIAGVPTRATAIFTAPGTVPASNNPALIEAKVDLKSKGYLLLLRNITITETIQPGIHLRINGGAWRHFNNTTSFADGESYVGSEGDYPYDQHAIYIRIAGGKAKGVGSWAWSDQGSTEENTTFEYIAKKPGPWTSYEHKYRNNDFDDWHMSPGSIRISEYKTDEFGDTWATGEFLIEKSTPFIEGVNGTPPAAQIKGNFKLQVNEIR